MVTKMDVTNDRTCIAHGAKSYIDVNFSISYFPERKLQPKIYYSECLELDFLIALICSGFGIVGVDLAFVTVGLLTTGGAVLVFSIRGFKEGSISMPSYRTLFMRACSIGFLGTGDLTRTRKRLNGDPKYK
uniref:Uncharacterized protein n=1 Tax=Glossina palpalis gambiensis TaxID=67801 RepID=A0A1B0BP41_9MUSC